MVCIVDDRNDLWNDVAGALDDDPVADADVLVVDMILVVQGRAGHDHAADGDRLEFGNRCQDAGAPDLNGNGFERRFGFFGRKLMGDCPSR